MMTIYYALYYKNTGELFGLCTAEDPAAVEVHKNSNPNYGFIELTKEEYMQAAEVELDQYKQRTDKVDQTTGKIIQKTPEEKQRQIDKVEGKTTDKL